MSEASAQGQMSKGHQHATNPPVNGYESIVDVDSVQNNETGNGNSSIDDGSAEGNPVNNVQNSDGGAVVQPDAGGGGGSGGSPAPGDTNMRRTRSFDEYMREKRGWTMMVAALFVQMAFQAALQPPTWIPANWYRQLSSYYDVRKHAPAPSPHYATAETPAEISLTKYQTVIVEMYVVCNTVTFAIALTILVTLLLVNRSSGMHASNNRVPKLFLMMALSSSATYVLANSHHMHLMMWVLCTIAEYVAYTLLYISFSGGSVLASSRTASSPAVPRDG